MTHEPNSQKLEDPNLAEATRQAYQHLPEKARAVFLKKCAHSRPRTLADVLRAAHIPPAFQPQRIERWLRKEHLGRIEDTILSAERAECFDNLLYGFFCQSHPVLNDRLLELIDPDGESPKTFEEALQQVTKEFSSDPYVELYVAATRWICRDAIDTHSKLLAERRAECSEHTTEDEASLTPDGPETEVSPAEESASGSGVAGKLVELDGELGAVDNILGLLQSILPVDLVEATSALSRASELASGLAAEVKSMAAAAGEGEPLWQSREEFLATRKRLARQSNEREQKREEASKKLLDVAGLLEHAEVYHRLPGRQTELTQLARRAAEELRQVKEPERILSIGGPTAARQWLEWMWTQEGTPGEWLQNNVEVVSPALAELLAAVDLSGLRWPSPQPSDTISAGATTPTGPAHAAVTEAAGLRVTQSTVESGVAASSSEVAGGPEPAPLEPAPPASGSAPAIKSDSAHQVSEVVTPRPDLHVPAADEQRGREQPEAPPHPQTTSPRTSGTTVESKAVETLPASAAESPPSISRIVWKLANDQRWGLAAHLVVLESDTTLPPAWVFQAAALGPRLNYEVSPISQKLASLFAKSAELNLDVLGDESLRATYLLLAGLSLRPALLAPQTGAAAVLQRLRDSDRLKHYPHFGGLVVAAADFSVLGQALRPGMLKTSHSQTDWESHVGAVRVEIRSWLEKAPHFGFNYAPAAQVWRKLLRPNGRLLRLMETLEHAEPSQVAELGNLLKPWAWRPMDQLQAAKDELSLRRSIEGTARAKLSANIAEAVDLANRLLALLAQAPGRADAYRDDRSQRLLALLSQHAAPAAGELERLAAQETTDAALSAVTLCATAVADLQRFFGGQLPLPGVDEPNPNWLLDAELLRDPGWGFSEGGDVEAPRLEHLERLHRLAASEPDWAATWTCHVEAEDHHATAALLEFLRWQPQAGMDLQQLEMDRQRSLDDCRSRLREEVRRTQRLLDEVVASGFCREQDYNGWSAEIEAVSDTGNLGLRFGPLHKRLRVLQETVRQPLEAASAEIRAWLEDGSGLTPLARDRIGALLANGDVHTAWDYRERIRDGRPLPDPSQPSLFEMFCGTNGWLQRAEEALSQVSWAELGQAVRTGGVWQGLDYQSLGVDQRERVLEQSRLWFDLERKGNAETAEVGKLAEALGLQPIPAHIRADPSLRRGLSVWHIRTEPIVDRNVAVVPEFGSMANGRYTLHLIWENREMEDLVTACPAEAGDTSSHIVIFFRPVSITQRRELAEQARERLFKAIVVDRALFAFACAQPLSRFATVLKCALPLTHVEPYIVAPGAVLPPEMFFGRRRELESLAAPLGSCFVYGGRQLGKTALLRALERSFHRPSQGRAAVWLDLKSELFSRGRPIDEFWTIVGTRLKEAGVLEDKVRPTTADTLFRHIKTWLEQAGDRRLLLLLDEADWFLEEDGKATEREGHFPRCQRLKGLMDETGRRFKVVFAGLHNVQRMTRVSNHPLAHFGEAICVGPMLEEAESRAARELVEAPMACAGYSFESPEVVSQILARSNYYPSLIQLFCHHLLRDLRQNHAARFHNRRLNPPFVINSQHVHAVYAGQVRRAIHEKVKLTLDLDRRYELIAYLLAFHHFGSGGKDDVDLRDLRADATMFWAAGFADVRTDDEFRGLLEEMVGLGVVRQVPNTQRFALRNPNVITLLGTEEEIHRQLEAAESWEPVLKYESDRFRRVLSERPKLTLSPLTAQQESEIRSFENRVVVLYGCPAAGLLDIPHALETLFGKERVILATDCTDAGSLSGRIAAVERPPGTHSLLVVPAACEWDESWVAAAAHRLAQFSSKTAFLTVLFVADPARAHAVVDGLDGAAELGVRAITLRPWHDATVRQWLESEPHRIPATQLTALREQIGRCTGNWPVLLGRLDPVDPMELDRSCSVLASMLGDPAEVARLLEDFGLAGEPKESPLRVAAELGGFSCEDICDYCGVQTREARQAVARRLSWAERVGLVSMSGGGLTFDPIVTRLLAARPAE